MKIVVMGYGRVGAQLVRLLNPQKHEIVVIDKDRQVFEDFPFEGLVTTVVGNGIDVGVLREAGAEKADVFFAVSRDENANLMAAQIAGKIFKIPKTVAMIYDPGVEGRYYEGVTDTFCVTVDGARGLMERLPREKEPTRLREIPPASLHPKVPAEVRTRTPSELGYVVIVGGGNVGYYLAKELLSIGYEVCVIEKDLHRSEELAVELDCAVVHGNGSAYSVLEKAGASRAQVLAAVTRHDQDNLISCQLAKNHFQVKKTIARVTNPRNEALLAELGVDATASSTSLIISEIERSLPFSRIKKLFTLQPGVVINEYALPKDSPAVGKSLKDLVLPKNCNIISIQRGKELLIPRGETVLQSDDEVIAIVYSEEQPRLSKILLGE